MYLKNVIIPLQDPVTRWDIRIEDDRIASMTPNDQTQAVEPPCLLVPPLCHPHIHLDKAYLLTCNHPPSVGYPDYSDLAPQSGTFEEALANTAEAKKRYTDDDLYLRGSQLLASSYKQGVTTVRAFVEVDHVTGFRPLKVGIQLKEQFADLVDVQICAFAQDPIFSTDYGDENRSLMEQALNEFGTSIDVLGTTPYVEADEPSSRKNIDWAVQTALRHGKHLDFHIEYNLNGGSAMRTFDYLIDALVAGPWPTERRAPTVVLGHATSLSQASWSDLQSLSAKIKTMKLPVHFVGLPTSDLYMMGRPKTDSESPLARPRGTLNVPRLIDDYGLRACLSVNNVGNAFTPYGTGDPLALACWGVGAYHAGTEREARLLYEAVSTRAVDAIMPAARSRLTQGEAEEDEETDLGEGKRWRRMILIRNEETLEIASAATEKTVIVRARPRLAIKDVVWDPPETRLRLVI